MSKFSPSLMCMDFLNMKEELKVLNERADYLHVDIMDGHYVKNITLSPDFVKSIKRVSKKPIDCHLMVTNPEDFYDMLHEAGADMISPQAEVINANAFRTINYIKSLGMEVGIVLNPSTPLEILKYYIHLLDKITVMTVDPGFAGQAFIDEMLDKIEDLSLMKKENNYKYIIEIDGSCNEKTFARLKKAGAEMYVVGSSGLFGLDKDVNKAWDMMLENYENAR